MCSSACLVTSCSHPPWSRGRWVWRGGSRGGMTGGGGWSESWDSRYRMKVLMREVSSRITIVTPTSHGRSIDTAEAESWPPCLVFGLGWRLACCGASSL